MHALLSVRLRFCALSKRFYAVARKRAVCVAIIGFLGFAGSAAIGLLLGIREPGVHDEFSYLLAADTFAHGRLTNPTHRMWVHFESIHIVQQPTYMSKYPPAQGLVLAVGQLLGGHPIVGVWLSAGLMCAAICWMLYAWVPPSWAVLGGFLSVIHPDIGIAGYWAQSYWGGAVAACGGALVAGGLRRIVRHSRVQNALIMGIGLAVLLNSRPYEGFLFSLPAGVLLLFWMLSNSGPSLRISLARITAPIFGVLAVTGIGMAFYNFRVTGNALRMPYIVHEETYGRAPLFLWQRPGPEPLYRHATIRDFHRAMLETVYNRQRSIIGYLREKKIDLRTQLGFYFGIMVLWLRRNRWLQFALLTYGLVVVGYLIETFGGKHYLAPLTGLVVVFMVQAMRLWRCRDPLIGRFVIFLVVSLSSYWLARSVYADMGKDHAGEWNYQRARIVRELEQTPGRHLVIVSYGPKHSIHEEWIYNGADIDGSKIVWARDMSQAENDRLMKYFSDRSAWVLNVYKDGSSSSPQLISLRTMR